ncbi:MAG: hypothetical protein WCK13_12815 [Ignavibacteriota bacterium]
MRIKLIFFATVLIFFAVSLSYSQTDTLKTLTVKGQKVVIGKYYEIIYPIRPPEKGKLIAVNKTTILMLIDNSIEEFDVEDIERIQGVEADNIIYTSGTKKNYKPVYSISAGYTQRDNSSNYSSYYGNYYSGSSYGSTLKFNGFNVTGDALIKSSEYFGFRFDLSYLHTAGKTVTDNSYYSGYDSSTYGSETVYAAWNIFTLKTGILFGSMAKEDPFNFYVYLGFGFGMAFSGGEEYNSYRIKNNITTAYNYPSSSRNDFIFGAHAQIRTSYRISPRYNVFIEPYVQYWTMNVNRLMGINGGVTFLL